MFEDLAIKTKHIFYRLFKARGSGFKYKPNKRDFNIGVFGWGKYTPKHDKHVIKTLSVRNQLPNNTCVFNTSIVSKEVDENKRLLVASILTWAKDNGLVSGDGWTNADTGQKALHKFGAMEYDNQDEEKDFKKISNIVLDKVKASENKIGSYWVVNTRDEILKLLDEGKVLPTAMKWYTGFNQRGGFEYPWIIRKKLGWNVGGHEFALKGYDTDKNLYVCQNSYGATWGDNGDFYVDMDYLDKNKIVCLANIDVEKDIGAFLNEYDGKNVKSSSSPAIFHIQKGKKKLYHDWLSYLSFNGKTKGFEIVDRELLEKVEDGDKMDIKKSSYWPMLKELKEPDNLNKLLEILMEK